MKGFAEYAILFLNTWELLSQLQLPMCTVGREKPGFKCLAQGHIQAEEEEVRLKVI